MTDVSSRWSGPPAWQRTKPKSVTGLSARGLVVFCSANRSAGATGRHRAHMTCRISTELRAFPPNMDVSLGPLEGSNTVAWQTEVHPYHPAANRFVREVDARAIIRWAPG